MRKIRNTVTGASAGASPQWVGLTRLSQVVPASVNLFYHDSDCRGGVQWVTALVLRIG